MCFEEDLGNLAFIVFGHRLTVGETREVILARETFLQGTTDPTDIFCMIDAGFGDRSQTPWAIVYIPYATHASYERLLRVYPFAYFSWSTEYRTHPEHLSGTYVKLAPR